MSTGPTPFGEHRDPSTWVTYVLGHPFHSLACLDARSAINGRRGVVALLDALLARMQSLHLTEGIRAGEPLWHLRATLAARAPRSRLGTDDVSDLGRTLLVVHAAVQVELRARADNTIGASPARVASQPRLLGKSAWERCPDGLRQDLADASRALSANLPTACVFHLYRVWDGLNGGPSQFVRPDGSPVADPRDDAGVRSLPSDASIAMAAVRRRLENE